jgi:hypothetical protein
MFIDEAGFHINLKRNFSWPKEGSHAVVKVPKTRTNTTTISPFGAVNISVRRPRTLDPSKKKRATGRTKANESNNDDTITDRYFNFVSSTLDVMDRHEHISRTLSGDG